MPLPSDEKLIQLGNELIHQFDAMFGVHPGFRPAHAKGVLLTGSFTPFSGSRVVDASPARESLFHACLGKILQWDRHPDDPR